MLKHLFETESEIVTAGAVKYVRSPEIATLSLTPDGLLVVALPELFADLPAPWSRLECEAVLDGKMPGDHIDPRAFARCMLRREARNVQRLEDDEDPVEAWPSHCAALVVAPNLPEWLREWERRGVVRLEAIAPGCTAVHPSLFPILWISANDLPLHEALIPFLIARSGTKLVEFVHWVVTRRSPTWMARVVQSLPKVIDMLPDFEPDVTPEDKQHIIAGLRRCAEVWPELNELWKADAYEEVRNEITLRAMAPLLRQFARRLGRVLTEDEQRIVVARLDTVGADRLGDVVLDLDPEALAQWLADPEAR